MSVLKKAPYALIPLFISGKLIKPQKILEVLSDSPYSLGGIMP